MMVQSIVIDSIKSKLRRIHIDTICIDHMVDFESHSGELFTIRCLRYCAWISDGYSTYGSYYYSDPDFFSMIAKRVRMIVKPTPVLHVYGPLSYMPCILDE